jgi:hypothetical protein
MSTAAASTSTVPGTTVVPSVPHIPMSTRKMPKPGEKNAPSFDPSKPEELSRFFERIEDWFSDENISDDDDKKRRIVRYLDPDSEAQWKALPKFTAGTFQEFKDEVMAAYPQAEEVTKGSVSALKRKIKQVGPVAADERDDLGLLIRIMTAEIVKLKKITPPIHTNRELVDLFLGRLTTDFASRVAQKLAMHRVVQATAAATQGARNPEDMYDIDEVMQVAKHTSLESANPFGKFLASNLGSQSEVTAKLEEAVVKLTDTMTINNQAQEQYMKRVDQRLSTFQTFLNQPRPAPQGLPTASSGFSRGLGPPQNHVQTGPVATCYYCLKTGHRMGDCEDMLRHIDLGWVKKIEGRWKQADGNQLPRDPVKSTKDLIEANHQSRPGIIPMSRIDKALYQGEAVSAYSQQQTTAGDDRDMRELSALVQRIGIDRLQGFLTEQTQDMIADEEEWEQNFH